jgi:hypothetical protein
LFAFDPTKYGAVFQPLLDLDRPDDLGPGKPNPLVQRDLDRLTVEAAFVGRKVIDRSSAQCCLAGVWLLHNYFDASHAISQEIETEDGSYWHGILHRREPDYGNAKYWFRRVANHPIFEELGRESRSLAAADGAVDGPAQFLLNQERWEASRFVDLCEKIASGTSSAGELASAIARLEWRMLFDHCYRKAIAT